MSKGFISREAGRVLNKNNATALRNAFKTIASVLKAAGIDLAKEDDEPDDDKTAKEAAGFSAGDMGTLLQAALDDTQEAPATGDGYRPPLRLIDIFDDYCVYTIGWSGTQHYRVDYSVTEDGTVTLGTPILVNRKVTYVIPALTDVDASEAGNILIEDDFVRLAESAVAADGTTRIKLIAPGFGSSGYYPADVLERDGPTAWPKGCKMYIDHDTPEEERERPEGTITRLAAVLEEDATFQRDPKHGPGLYARAKVFEGHRSTIDEIAPYIGTSIRADGRARMGVIEGRRIPIIEQIKPFNGVNNRVDFVTAPGAGGKVIALFESARNRAATVTEAATPPIVEDQEMTPEEIKKLIEAQVAAAVAPLQQENARLSEALALSEATGLVNRHLADPKFATLPAATRARLAPQIARGFVLTEAGRIDAAALIASADQAVADELAYLSEAVPGFGRIRGLGDSRARQADEGATSGVGAGPSNEEELATTFVRWGMTESAAKRAARGR